MYTSLEDALTPERSAVLYVFFSSINRISILRERTHVSLGTIIIAVSCLVDWKRNLYIWQRSNRKRGERNG
jgi:hypothetical protein